MGRWFLALALAASAAVSRAQEGEVLSNPDPMAEMEAMEAMPHWMTMYHGYAFLTGDASLHDYFLRFLVPTLVGNTVGGMSLVALLNHAAIAPEINGHR